MTSVRQFGPKRPLAEAMKLPLADYGTPRISGAMESEAFLI
jgi:hypothetical protein